MVFICKHWQAYEGVDLSGILHGCQKTEEWMLREEGLLSKSQVPTAEVLKGTKGFASALDTP